MPITRHAPALLYPKHLCLTPAFVACRDALLASPIILHEPMAALRGEITQADLEPEQ